MQQSGSLASSENVPTSTRFLSPGVISIRSPIPCTRFSPLKKWFVLWLSQFSNLEMNNSYDNVFLFDSTTKGTIRSSMIETYYDLRRDPTKS
jgi:hypothetical protein